MKHPGTFRLKVENTCYEPFTTADITASADGSHNAGALRLMWSEPAGTDRYSITQKSPGSFKLTVKECVREIGNNEFSSSGPIITAAAASEGVADRARMITEIALPSTLRSIGESGLANHARASGTLRIPRNVETLADTAFLTMALANSEALTVVFETGSKLRSIGESTFLQSRLRDFTLPENLETIGAGAFFFTQFLFSTDSSSPGTLIIPSKVSRINRNAFRNIGGDITVVDIRSDQLRKPPTGAALGDNLFQDVTGITVKLPQTVYNSYSLADRIRIFGTTITLTPVP